MAGDRTILLAEDDGILLEALEMMFRQRGYGTLVARDGSVALRLARAQPPAVVVSDVDMPGMDGVELLRQLRADRRTRSTRFVFISADPKGELRAQANGLGADAYFFKPFDPSDLLVAVERLVGAPS